MQNVLYNEKQPHQRPYATVYKPTLDRVFGLIAFLFALPVMAMIGVLVRVILGAPMLDVQTRAGYKGVPIKVYQFRTLAQSEEGTAPVYQRNLGRGLRYTQLDKLPHLYSVMRGDLSFIGPRPLLMEYLPLYTAEQARRHDVRPGLMGMAQIYGGHDKKWEEKFSWDLHYVDHVSFLLDLKILWAALFGANQVPVVRPDSASSITHARRPSPYIMSNVMTEVLISEADWGKTPTPVRSACQVMANRISILDRQLENAHTEREIYRTQMLDMKVRLEAALAMLQLSVPVDTTLDKADTWLDDPETQPSRIEPILDEKADDRDVLRVVNMTVTQDQNPL